MRFIECLFALLISIFSSSAQRIWNANNNTDEVACSLWVGEGEARGGVCGTGSCLGLSKQIHWHTLKTHANYEHACEQWTVNKGNLYENTKVSHRALLFLRAEGELTAPMTGQNKQKEDADTDASADRDADTETDPDTDTGTHCCVGLCYCYFWSSWCWISNWLPGVTWGTVHCDKFLD